MLIVCSGSNAGVAGESVKFDLSDLEQYGPYNQTWQASSTGIFVYVDRVFGENITKLFDGNYSTTMDINVSGWSGMSVNFPGYVNVSHIRMYPLVSDDNSSLKSLYSILSRLSGSGGVHLVRKSWVEDNISQINKKTDYLEHNFSLTVNNLEFNFWAIGETFPLGRYCFNEIEIYYTPEPGPEIDELKDQINNLTISIESLQGQIDNLTQQLNTLNSTVNDLSKNQQKILENITNLWESYNQLNQSLTRLIDDLENLNISTLENITWLEQNLTIIKTDISNIQDTLNQIPMNETDLSDLQNQINQTTQNINYLNKNITDIQNTMPIEYNDTTLMKRIADLEGKNAQLTAENAKLQKDIDTLKNTTKKVKIIDKQPDNTLVAGAFGIGILGTALGVGALISKRPKIPTELEEEMDSWDESNEDDDKGPTDIPKGKAKKIKKK